MKALGTSEDRFAIPDLRDQSQRSVSSDNRSASSALVIW